MVDPTTPRTEAAEVLHSPTGTTSPAVSVRPFPATPCKLVAGERWHGYQIDGPSATEENVFEATHIGRMERVQIAASLLNKFTASRRGVWEQLSKQLPAEAKILACLEAEEEEGWRYEVVSQPPATTLRDWMTCHQADGSMQRQLLEQLVVTLSALHSLGIVHLNIRPELIYFDEESDKPEFVLGGLNNALVYKQARIPSATVDPFYAPPEAVDADGRQPGFGLCAWDWWSVGRVIQEITLGRHVMSMLFGSDVVKNASPELCERAKNLLLETEPPGMRAGAIEAMGELPPAVKVMLRGLLTSARDARWGAESVRLWLSQEGVSNYYHLARNARFFTWKGRGRSLSEAAQFFRTEEHWTDGETNLFEPENPETLAYFLTTAKDHSADLRRVEQIRSQLDSPELSAIGEPARRSLTAAFVWLALGPQPGALVVKGRRIDAVGLSELLGGDQESANLEIVKALMSPPCLALITPVDASAAEALTQLAELGGFALRQAEQHAWIDANDAGGQAHVLKLSLEGEPALRKRADRARNTYATCENAILAGMLADEAPAAWVEVLLVFTAENARRFGYVTKTEYTRQGVTRLQARGERLQVALFWLHLRKTLQAGKPWSGAWQPFIVSWLCLVVFGVVVARDVQSTAAVAFALLGLRLVLGWRVDKLALKCDPSAVPRWSWRDGPERCEAEAQRLWPEGVADLYVLAKQADEMEVAMAPLQPAVKKIFFPSHAPRLVALWPVYALAALVSIVGAVQLLKNLGQRLGYQVLSIAWTDSGDDRSLAKRYAADTPEEIATQLQNIPNLSAAMVEKVKKGEYEIVKESFGYTLHGPIQKWNFTPPAVVPPLPIESRAPATSAQRAFALVSGELLLRPYGKKGVTALFIVPIPTKTGFGLMVYNAKARKLMDNVALTVHTGPANDTWYRVDHYNVIYLGAPSQVDADKVALVSQR
ncbi:MAG: serine/threonine-protein kinase [Lacunisphaera sp.]